MEDFEEIFEAGMDSYYDALSSVAGKAHFARRVVSTLPGSTCKIEEVADGDWILVGPVCYRSAVVEFSLTRFHSSESLSVQVKSGSPEDVESLISALEYVKHQIDRERYEKEDDYDNYDYLNDCYEQENQTV